MDTLKAVGRQAAQQATESWDPGGVLGLDEVVADAVTLAVLQRFREDVTGLIAVAMDMARRDETTAQEFRRDGQIDAYKDVLSDIDEGFLQLGVALSPPSGSPVETPQTTEPPRKICQKCKNFGREIPECVCGGTGYEPVSSPEPVNLMEAIRKGLDAKFSPAVPLAPTPPSQLQAIQRLMLQTLGDMGVENGKTLADVQRKLHVDAPTAMRLFALLNAVASLPSSPSPGAVETLTSDDWDQIEDGLNALIDESANQADLWAGRGRETRYRLEVADTQVVLDKVQSLRSGGSR